jgi:hypothetical protein
LFLLLGRAEAKPPVSTLSTNLELVWYRTSCVPLWDGIPDVMFLFFASASEKQENSQRVK